MEDRKGWHSRQWALCVARYDGGWDVGRRGCTGVLSDNEVTSPEGLMATKVLAGTWKWQGQTHFPMAHPRRVCG